MHFFVCVYSKIRTLNVSSGYTVHNQQLLITEYAAVCTYHAENINLLKSSGNFTYNQV